MDMASSVAAHTYMEVTPDLEAGDEVIAGQVIGDVGNSGTLEGVRDANAPVTYISRLGSVTAISERACPIRRF